MTSSTALLASATLLSLVGTSSAFAPPSLGSSLVQPHHHAMYPNRLQCRPRRRRQQQQQQSPLFVQSKDSVFAGTENDTSITLDSDDSDSDDGSNNIETELAVARIERVFTTSEEASIYLADAPVTPSEGAYIAEEGPLTSDGLFWRGAVVILCALWASNFACAKVVLAQPGVDASLYAVARFGLAALSLLPGSINAARKGAISWETARGAMICGSWVAFGYLGQSIGLITTTPSRSCVICSLNCIFVAIVAEFLRVGSTEERGYKTSFDLRKLIPAMIAVTGVAIIELKGAAGDPTVGDLISFSQPVGFGMGYLILEKLMRKQPGAALPVSAIKLAVVATASLAFFEASPHAASLAAGVDPGAVAAEAARRSSLLAAPDFTPILSSPVASMAILYTGLVTTSLALWVESVAFQRVPATDASIILTTEPLFAAATSAALVGETFGASDAIGAFFIVGACIYAIKMGESKEVCDENTKECVVGDFD